MAESHQIELEQARQEALVRQLEKELRDAREKLRHLRWQRALCPTESELDEACQEALVQQLEKQLKVAKEKLGRLRRQRVLYPVQWLWSGLQSPVRWPVVLGWSALGETIVVLVAELA